MTKIVAFFLVILTGLGVLGNDYHNAKADEIKIAKPKIYVKAVDNSIKVTVKYTENAEGYSIYLKGTNDKRYHVVASIEAK